MSAGTESLGVLVGFDNSDHAIRALHWGAAEALQRGCQLTVMTAFTVPRGVEGYMGPKAESTADTMARKGAENLLEHARDLLSDYPGTAEFLTRYGDAAGVLVAHSSDAQLAVVGARGRGGFIGRMLGSVSSALPAHASCPTVVVEPTYQPPEPETEDRYAISDRRPVAVGVDHSPGSRVAALHAAEIADARQVPLRMVMAIPPIDTSFMWYPEMGPDPETAERHRAEIEDRLAHQVQWLSRHYEHVTISPVVADGLPAAVLRDETEHAQLTVVGTRGRGGFATAMLGSTSAGVVSHASGPVMVVPALTDVRLEDAELR